MTALTVLLVLGGEAIAGQRGMTFALLMAVVMNGGAYFFSDKIALMSSGAQTVSREQLPRLYEVMERLTGKAALPMPKLYVIPQPAPNAFATGRNPSHASVAVTAGLMELMNDDELEGVIAHELSHIGNRDTLLGTVVVVLVGFIAIMSDMFMRASMFGGDNRDRDNRLGIILMIAGIVLAILAPIVAQLIQLAISRRREFLADASGALLTRYPDGLASALEKISAYPQGLVRQNTAMAHLYISNPLKKAGAQSFMSKLFSTHPPTEERIAALKGMEV